MDPFVHLRVASGYSLRYGASHPGELVAAAAAQDMDSLALTDRDGLYGAVRFAKACLRTGLAPIVGVDLAVPFTDGRRPASSHRRTAARGGQLRDPRLPRVVATATSRTGWASLCRLVTDTHLAGERGRPVASPELFARHADGGDLLVSLGADSQFGLHVAAGRADLARDELRRWLDLVGPEQLQVAVTHHQVGGDGVTSARQAGRMLALADEHRLTAVLTNQVRMAERGQAATIDVLDAARRRVPLDARNVDRRNAEAHLKPGKQMLRLAEEVARLAGRGERGAEQLLADTRLTALRCRLDPRADIGLGELHLPEFETLGTSGDEAMAELRARCEAGVAERYGRLTDAVRARLHEELAVIGQLGYAAYFLTVAQVVGMVRELGIRCAARGSGAGSLVNYLLGISGVDPLAYGLVMERFLSPLRQALPDIDLDVESARRTEIYERVLAHFGGQRVACVAMVETYRVRHAVRDVAAALSLPPAEADAIAKAFPHIRARDARKALRDLPELRAAGLAEPRLEVLFRLVESLDGLPRHVALHPCGVILSDTTLAQRTPLEASHGGFPMSQFDKDDVEDLGLLKLDVLGIRMQSAMAHALGELERTTGSVPDVDSLAPFDDPSVYRMIGHAQTLGCFQIESPGQRELVGKFGPSTFNDVIIDISLFRPGPVKSDMVVPFLNARQGWTPPKYLHPDLAPVLAETGGVVVFHEQIIKIISVMTGCSLAQGDEARRALGSPAGQLDVKDWFVPLARQRGYSVELVERVWQVLEAFASFGFCKAHAAAFALPTYQSAWLKWYHPAHFLAGVLTHDPGMYPKRLILEEARRCKITILGVDVNHSTGSYRVEPVPTIPEPTTPIPEPVEGPAAGLPDGSAWAIRLSLADVKGISEVDVARIVAGQPYSSLSDFWARVQPSAPLAENLVLAGAFDELYGVGRPSAVLRHGRLTRRDLLLALADLVRQQRADVRAASRARGLRRASLPTAAVGDDPRDLARRQARAEMVPGRAAERMAGVQLALDFTEPAPEPDPATVAEPVEAPCGVPPRIWFPPRDVVATGLPEMDHDERLAAELEILGLDASRHVVAGYRGLLAELAITASTELLTRRQQADLLVAGVKVATQTPPVRSGRRVVFLTLDDATGPVDCTFFEDAQGPYASTVFNSWLLVVRGELRRTGPRGVSLRATGAWDLTELHQVWREKLDAGASRRQALAAVLEIIERVPEGAGLVGERVSDVEAYTDWRTAPPVATSTAPEPVGGSPEHETRAGGMGQRRVLVHASGFKQSPYADVKPAGAPASQPPRKLWHSSPGSSGR
ncbi:MULTISPECIES: DNA polymerase III subunit alpha [unclassified Luteococcus]|uniref:DNA polymerase III subunit alpha n=1 Tax=unclassified Luteococcus TaxID=2639923 RepID=UPI00313BDF5C